MAYEGDIGKGGVVAGGRPREASIRDLLTKGKTLFNAWISLGIAYSVELAGEAGADLVTIDQQHGIGGNAELLACLTAASASGIPALVRVAKNDFGLVGRALDAGAQGVMCPMINTPEDARAFVEAVKYPPVGARSMGPYRGRLLIPDYIKNANGWTIACGQIETKTALGNLDAIFTTPGFDMVCVGPNDLAFTLSGGAHADIRAPETEAAIDLILAKCREHGVIAGIFANDADYAKSMIAKGWQVVAMANDARWLASGARAARAVFD
jgi:4-hydroxy-2-oxoheptanedioate aldolase